jgi:hypothetical protein
MEREGRSLAKKREREGKIYDKASQQHIAKNTLSHFHLQSALLLLLLFHYHFFAEAFIEGD